MEIEEIEVLSLGDLIDRVTPANPDPATGRRRDTGVYRGTADSSQPLLTNLDRLGGIDPPQPKPMWKSISSATSLDIHGLFSGRRGGTNGNR